MSCHILYKLMLRTLTLNLFYWAWNCRRFNKCCPSDHSSPPLPFSTCVFGLKTIFDPFPNAIKIQFIILLYICIHAHLLPSYTFCFLFIPKQNKTKHAFSNIYQTYAHIAELGHAYSNYTCIVPSILSNLRPKVFTGHHAKARNPANTHHIRRNRKSIPEIDTHFWRALMVLCINRS